MLGECRKSGVDGRLEPQGLGNAGLEVVADDGFRHATEETQRPLLTLDPVRQPLSEACIGEGVQGGWQNRDEDLRQPDFARHRIDHRDGLAGVVGLHRRAGSVAIAEGGAGALFESGEPLAEPRVSVTVGVPFAIFLPQQRQCHALPLQFTGDLAPVGFVHVLGRTAATMEQAALQNAIIVQPRRQRPARQPGLTRPQQVGRNGRFADLQPFRYRTNRKPLFVRQSQYRSNVLHVSKSHLLPPRHSSAPRSNRGPEWQNGACESRSLYAERLSGIYRNRCPRISGNAVPDLVKSLSGI